MSTPARTPAAGLPRPVWPSRPVPPTAPGQAERTEQQDVRPRARAAAPPVPARPAAPVEAAPRVVPPPEVAPSEPAAEVPAEEIPLDPRSIARASLAAGRNRSLWWTMSGIVASVAVAFVTDAVVGSYVLALLLLASAVVRAVTPAPGPVAVSVRSKPLDVAVLATGALALAVLASLLPPA
ncbi:DUF3017 domain-containing protein [Cellulomonas dongxiuzhuiae]|uniref:DUF3017 domain-containing protein n=1 Tax=Cellulomonas dongxiuzhuiae TaxID=2819979 RepID=UPI001FB9D02B|nr:DUF3017 domain-containing protein [Cellulomonas dongxiuzhuiae]